MNLAIKDIKHNAGRFILTAVGLGLLLMIVMGMSGIYTGIVKDAVQLIDDIHADIWIVQGGTKGPFAENSKINQSLIYRAVVIPGVQSARGFVQHTIQREYKGRQLRMAVVGIDYPEDNGNWLKIIKGRGINNAHYEMIADSSLGLKIGDKITLNNNIFTVVGITSNMFNSSGDGSAFFTLQDALGIQNEFPGEAIRLERNSRSNRVAELNLGRTEPNMIAFSKQSADKVPSLNASSKVSAVILTLKPGTDVKKVLKTLDGWEDISAYTSNTQKEFLLSGAVEKVKKQIGLFSLLLTIISGIIMALILYTLTLDKIRSISLLKLMGASNFVILKLIFSQALFLGLSGYLIGLFLGWIVFPYFPRRVIISENELIKLFIIVIIISFLSSLMGIKKALSVKPNDALN